MTSVICSKCGHENQAGANFCSSCGHPAPEEEPRTVTFSLDPEAAVPDDVELEAEASGAIALLVATRGPNAGSEFTLEHVITTAGRHPDSDLFLDDVTVSRRHAEVERTVSGYVIRDVGSLNGTYLNQQLVQGDTPLANGDEVQVGLFKLVFVHGADR